MMPLGVFELCDYEKVKDRIYCQLRNIRDIEIGNHVATNFMMDMAITYRILLEENSEKRASAVITNKMIDMWTEGSCYKRDYILKEALKNTQEKNPPVIKDYAALLGIDDECPLKVLTTDGLNCGAIAICYKGIGDLLRKYTPKYAYLLPSSIHEWMVMPANEFDPEFYYTQVQMVTEINRNELAVSKEDILSSSVLFFDATENSITSFITNRDLGAKGVEKWATKKLE